MSCGFNMFIRHSCLFISRRLGGNATFLGLLFGQIFKKFYWFLEKSVHFNIFCSPRVRRAFRQVWTISCQTKICVELTSPQRVKPEFLLLLPDGVDSGFVTGHRGQHRRRPEARSSHGRGEEKRRWMAREGKSLGRPRSESGERSSEALHAIVAVTLCKAFARLSHKQGKRSFSGSVSPFPWQIQNVVLKPVWKMSCISGENTGNVGFFEKKNLAKKKKKKQNKSKTRWHVVTEEKLRRCPDHLKWPSLLRKISLPGVFFHTENTRVNFFNKV